MLDIVSVRPARFPLPPLLRATTFRLALSYLGIFTVSAVALLALVSWNTSLFLEWQVQETVEAEVRGLSEQYSERGIPGLITVINERAAQDVEHRSAYMLRNPQEEHVAGNLIGWPGGIAKGAEWIRFTMERLDNQRIASDVLARIYVLPQGYALLVGRSMKEGERVKSAINRALGWGLALTILLGIVGGYLTSRHLLQRVDAMSRTARKIIGGDMTSRMRLAEANDEFDQLATSFNDMMDEVEQSVTGMRAVTDNIAHDLRTPLNRLRSRIDLALLSNSDAPALRRVLEETMAEADHLLATFNALLAIGSAESGERLHSFEDVSPAFLVRDVVELYEPLAEEKGILVSSRTDCEVLVRGDRHLLFQALANLVDNAVKYTPSGGRLFVSVTECPEGVAITVSDSGPGIPFEARATIFGRFVRLDTTRSTPGNGLGLALVKAVVDLHGATLALQDNMPGLRVRLTLKSEKGNPTP